MNSIAQTNQSEKQLSEKMQSFLSRYHVGRLLRSANAYKLRGFPVLSVFLVLFHRLHATLLLHADEPAIQCDPLCQGHLLPLHEFLPHPLAQIHNNARCHHHRIHT